MSTLYPTKGHPLTKKERNFIASKEGFAVRVMFSDGSHSSSSGIVAICRTHRGAAIIAGRDRGRFERGIVVPVSEITNEEMKRIGE